MSDLRDVILDSVVDRDDEIDATGTEAKAKVKWRDVLSRTTDSASLVYEIKRAALAVSASRLEKQMDIVVKQVYAEGQALKKEDATQMTPISKEDVDGKRASRGNGNAIQYPKV